MPPLIYWAVSGGIYWGTYTLWQYGQTGYDAAGLGALVLAVYGLSWVWKGFSSWSWRRQYYAAEKAARTPRETHGKARWGTRKDAKRAGMFEPGGLFLGSLDGKDLFYHGEAHLMCMAPAGAGKGACVVIPNLLTYSGSMIVTDPKGELAAVTARHRREKLGHNVVMLNPWREKLTKELGRDLGDDGFNPLSILKPGPDVKDDAEMVASLLIPGRANMSGSEEFFIDFGRSILSAFMLYLVSREVPDRVTLPELRRMIMAPPDVLQNHLDAMAACGSFSGVIHEYAGKLSGTLENAPEEFQGGLSTAQKSLTIFDMHGPLGGHVSRGTFDLTSIKDTPTTVYVIMPSDRAGTHASWLNLVISLAIELVGRDRTTKRVVFLLDEFANLGYLPGVLRAMAQYRGQGVQVFTIIHLISQLRRLYGKDGWHEFFGLSECISTFGVWELETIRLISDWIGQETVKDFSQSIRPEIGIGATADLSFGAADRGTPLIRPEDIRAMEKDRQLIFYANQPPFYAEKISYLKRREWQRLAALNPYHCR